MSQRSVASVASMKSPLLACSSGTAVVAPLTEIARKAHVDADELRHALWLHNDRREFVEVCRDSAGATIGDDTGMHMRAKVLHGTQHEAPPPTEESGLLRRAESSLCTPLVQDLELGPTAPASVRIAAKHVPSDAIFMLPSTGGECIVVVEGQEAEEAYLSHRHLPTAISAIQDIGISQDGFYYVVIEKARPAVIWLLLVAAVVGLSSKAIVAKSFMYPASVGQIAKSVWMTTVAGLGFGCMALVECLVMDVHAALRQLMEPKSVSVLPNYVFGTEELQKHKQTGAQVRGLSALLVVLASLCHGVFSVCFLVSLQYTTLEMCVVLMNLHPLLVLAAKYSRSTATECAGALAVVAGVVSLTYATPPENVASNPMLGNLLAFTVSVLMWMYLCMVQNLQEELPNGLLMVFVNSGSIVVQMLLLAAFEPQSLGLMNADAFSTFWLPNMLGGLCGGFLAYGGFMLAARYLGTLVVSVHITTEPLFAVLIQVLVAGPMPPWSVWASLLVLASGAAVVVLGGNKTTKVVSDYGAVIDKLVL
eukprot:Rhum_TRINITY_DN3240_c0_g1::Rhum_TRINITY_DN3240_c0_g1_i1::g.9957::m.9957